MSGLRFLERLRRISKEGDKERSSVGTEDCLASIIGYVCKILNTRQGSSVLDEGFGIPDFTAIGATLTMEHIPEIEEEIASFITRYEPRLHEVTVSFVPDKGDAMLITFSLSAEMDAGEGAVIPVHLLTKVSPLGRVSVSG